MPPVIRLAIAQFKAQKGDYPANLERLGEIFAQIHALEPRPHVLQLPETALTGYFVEGGVRDLAMTAGAFARDLHTAYRSAVPSPQPLDVALGFYEVWHNTLYNSAMYVTLGPDEPIIRHVHRKELPPHLRTVRRGAICGARARDPRLRHLVGARRHPRL